MMIFNGQNTLNKGAQGEELIRIRRQNVGQMPEIWQVVSYMGQKSKPEDWVEQKIWGL